NKMDLVGWDPAIFESIREAYTELAERLGIDHFHIIPISALKGDNVVEGSANTPWYSGPPLLSLLEELPISAAVDEGSSRFFVQWVIRHGGHDVNDFRGYAGQL